jgi:hypothetical protein
MYRFTVAVPSAQQFVAKVNIFRIRSLLKAIEKAPYRFSRLAFLVT